MTDAEISLMVSRADAFIGRMFHSFTGCAWDAEAKCFVYAFRLEADAEKFMLWKQEQGSPLRLEKTMGEDNAATVKEYME
jgi:hypothetical protein